VDGDVVTIERVDRIL